VIDVKTAEKGVPYLPLEFDFMCLDDVSSLRIWWWQWQTG
jgi:hypothetical protein